MNFQALFERKVHPGIAVAARYLQEIAVADAVPCRRDFRPNKVRSILGYIFFVDALPQDYHFSLVGVNIAVLFGTDGTNKRLSELSNPQLVERMKATYDEVIASQTFSYVRGQYTWPDCAVNIDRLLVPMRGADGQVNTIFGLALPDCAADMLVITAGVGMAKLVIEEQLNG